MQTHGRMPEKQWNPAGSSCHFSGAYPFVYYCVWMVYCELQRLSSYLAPGHVLLMKKDVFGQDKDGDWGARYPKVMRPQRVLYC